MKILHLLYESRGDYFGIGGVGIRAYEIYRRLAERHEITLLCKKYPGSADEAVLDGLQHIFVGSSSPNLAVSLLSYARRAGRFVRDEGSRYDVVVEEFSPAIPTFLFSFRRSPVILQIQGYTGGNYFGKYNPLYSGFLYMTERFTPRLYRNLIFVSEAEGKRYRVGARSRVCVISNGVDRRLIDTVPGESGYILYLGRIDIHHKGLDILLDAYAGFQERFPDIKLVIAGDGRDRDRFLALLGRLSPRVRENIELKGWVEGEEKAGLLRSALFSVMPSRYETQGIAALEALACAKPVVVSDIPELRYVTEHEAGSSFSSGDVSSLAKAMAGLAGSRCRREMGERGRQWVKGFTFEKVALQYEAFLEEISGGAL